MPGRARPGHRRTEIRRFARRDRPGAFWRKAPGWGGRQRLENLAESHPGFVHEVVLARGIGIDGAVVGAGAQRPPASRKARSCASSASTTRACTEARSCRVRCSTALAWGSARRSPKIAARSAAEAPRAGRCARARRVRGDGTSNVVLRIGMDKDGFVRFPCAADDRAKRVFADGGSIRARADDAKILMASAPFAKTLRVSLGLGRIAGLGEATGIHPIVAVTLSGALPPGAQAFARGKNRGPAISPDSMRLSKCLRVCEPDAGSKIVVKP